MNYLILLVEAFVVFILMLLFYRISKKDGMFLYIGFLSSLLVVFTFKFVNIFSFEVGLGIPIIMGIFLCSNVIIQRYGIDEIKDIIKSFVIPFVITFVIFSLVSIVSSSEYNLATNVFYDGLFGYSLNNLRLVVGTGLAVSFALWYNAYVYYYIKKSKNKYLFSNIGSMFITQFFESFIFTVISYVGLYGFDMLFGMIIIGYLIKIVIGLVSLIPFIIVLKMKS